MVAAAVAALLAAPAIGGGARTPAVVAVRVAQAGGTSEIATGVVVAPGRVLTVGHVLEGGRGVTVGGEPATVLRRRAGQDLALLAAPGADGPRVRYGAPGGDLRVLVRAGEADDEAARGDEPRGGLRVPAPATARPARLRRRIVAQLADAPGRPRRRALELAARVAPGDSGAPVVDGRGRVVGIVFARSTRRDGVAYAVRTDDAQGVP